MASLTQWTWVWASSGRWWRTGKPGVLRSIASQSRTRLRGRAELNWTDDGCGCFQRKFTYGPWGSNFIYFFHVIKQSFPFFKVCCLVTKLCLTLQPRGLQHARPSFLHLLPGSAQTPVHGVDGTIQTSHPLLPVSPAFNLSQHQGLFQWAGTLPQVAKVLELQHQFFQWIFRVDFLWDWLVGSPCSPRDSQEPSPATRFKSINSLVLFYTNHLFFFFIYFC